MNAVGASPMALTLMEHLLFCWISLVFFVSESVRIWGDGGRLPEDNYVRGGSVVLAWRRNLRHALIVPATHWIADFDALEHVAVD